MRVLHIHIHGPEDVLVFAGFRPLFFLVRLKASVISAKFCLVWLGLSYRVGNQCDLSSWQFCLIKVGFV